MLSGIVWHYTLWHCLALCSMALYGIILGGIVWQCAQWHCMALYSVALYGIIISCMHCMALYSAVLYREVSFRNEFQCYV